MASTLKEKSHSNFCYCWLFIYSGSNSYTGPCRSPVKHFSTMVEGVHGEVAVSMRPHRIIEQCGRVHYYGVEVDVCFACNLYLCGEGREDGRGDFEHLIACTHNIGVECTSYWTAELQTVQLIKQLYFNSKGYVTLRFYCKMKIDLQDCSPSMNLHQLLSHHDGVVIHSQRS